MTETLAEKKCTPCRGGIPPLTHEEAERFQSQTPNWELRDDAHRIERTFRFRNFQEALGFVRNVGDLAEGGSVPIPARNRSISESAAKANWRFGTPLPMPFSSARRSCLGRMMHFSPLSSSSSTGSRSIQCSAPARCDCSQSTWKMLGRRSQRCCNGRKLTRLRSSAVALASTPTRNFLEPSRVQPALSPYCFQSRSPLGTHWLGSLKCFRARQSRGTKWN